MKLAWCAALLLVLAPSVVSARTVTVAAAGDIACDQAHGARGGPSDLSARCHAEKTAELIRALHPDAVLPLGDLQYYGEDVQTFRSGYGASWGAFDAIAHPVAGNHEYEVPAAAGFFGYFGRTRLHNGWYSWNLGDWHFIALDGNCTQAAVGGCDTHSPQYRWLLADLKAHPRGCRLAYWHQPRFSSGPHGNASAYADFWKALYDARVDVVLNGHDHGYERFTPLDPDERTDNTNGIREFIVGTGGRNHSPFFFPPHFESIVRNNTAFGILQLTLRRADFDWRFIAEPGAEFSDSGHAVCHRP